MIVITPESMGRESKQSKRDLTLSWYLSLDGAIVTILHQNNVRNVMIFTLAKQVICSRNVWMGTGLLAWSWTLTYQYPSTPNPISFLSRYAVPSLSLKNFLTMSTVNLKRQINLYFNPSLLVSTSANLTQPPPPLLPFFPPSGNC